MVSSSSPPVPPTPQQLSYGIDLASISMRETFGVDPWAWQTDILTHLFAMIQYCEPVLLVRPTGGGKSMVRDVYASTQPGKAVLSLAPLLSLSKDQTTKLEHKTLTHKLTCIHLDEYRSPKQVAVITNDLRKLPDTDGSVVLFASPQILGTTYRRLLDMLIKEGILSMVCIDEIHLFVEFGHRFRAEFLHLQRLLFRPLLHRQQPPTLPRVDAEGVDITEVPPSRTTVPILFMTATSDSILLQQIEKITGYVFRHSNLFWPDAMHMQQRRQTIRYMPTTKVSGILRKLTRPCFEDDADGVDLTLDDEPDDEPESADMPPLEAVPDDTIDTPPTVVTADGANPSTNNNVVSVHGDSANAPVLVHDGGVDTATASTSQKFISYGNSRVATDAVHQSYQEWLDKKELRGDAMKVTGAMARPSKWHRCSVFLNPHAVRGLSATNFNARGCFTTRAMGSAGWDDSSIHYIFSIDFPTDILSIAQEKGRAGRRLGADGSEDTYYCCASLEAYLYLLRRFSRETPTDDGVDPEDERLFDRFITPSALKRHQLFRLSQVLDVFVLPRECQQCMLERGLANPFTDPSSAPLIPCGNRCQFCIDGGIHPKFPRIHVAGVRAALVDLFIGERIMDNPSFDKGGVIDALRNYPGAQLSFFGVKSKALPKPIDIKNLLLMLITANIVTHRVVQRDVTASDGTVTQRPDILARLQMKPDLTLAVYDDALWARLPIL